MNGNNQKIPKEKNINFFFKKTFLSAECMKLSWATYDYETFEEIPLIDKYCKFSYWLKYSDDWSDVFRKWVIFANFIFAIVYLDAKKSGNSLCITFNPDSDDELPPRPNFFVFKTKLFKLIIGGELDLNTSNSKELIKIKSIFYDCGFSSFEFFERIYEDEWGVNHRIYAVFIPGGFKSKVQHPVLMDEG